MESAVPASDSRTLNNLKLFLIFDSIIRSCVSQDIILVFDQLLSFLVLEVLDGLVESIAKDLAARGRTAWRVVAVCNTTKVGGLGCILLVLR
jgi:hypothetical protein